MPSLSAPLQTGVYHLSTILQELQFKVLFHQFSFLFNAEVYCFNVMFPHSKLSLLILLHVLTDIILNCSPQTTRHRQSLSKSYLRYILSLNFLVKSNLFLDSITRLSFNLGWCFLYRNRGNKFICVCILFFFQI